MRSKPLSESAGTEVFYIPWRTRKRISVYRRCGQINMSRDITKQTKWLCAKRRLRSAWESAQSDQSSAKWVAKDPSFSSCLQGRLWSDWADAQADLSLRWAQSHFISCVMLRSNQNRAHPVTVLFTLSRNDQAKRYITRSCQIDW